MFKKVVISICKLQIWAVLFLLFRYGPITFDKVLQITISKKLDVHKQYYITVNLL